MTSEFHAVPMLPFFSQNGLTDVALCSLFPLIHKKASITFIHNSHLIAADSGNFIFRVQIPQLEYSSILNRIAQS